MNAPRITSSPSSSASTTNARQEQEGASHPDLRRSVLQARQQRRESHRAADTRAGHFFVKRFLYQASARYPDLGSCVEVFTNSEMLELETLAPLARLDPGDAC